MPAHAILYYSVRDYERLRYITDQTFSEAKLYASKKAKKTTTGKNGKKKARTSLAQGHKSKKEEEERAMGETGEMNEENEEEKETHLHFLEQQYKRDVSALRTMRRFCESHMCRRRYILNYFGEDVREGKKAEEKKRERDRERESLKCKKGQKDSSSQDRERMQHGEELLHSVKREKKCEEDQKQDELNQREKPPPSIKSEDIKTQRSPQNLGGEGVRQDQQKKEEVEKQQAQDNPSLTENNGGISSSFPESEKMKCLASHFASSSSSSYRCCDICERGNNMPERTLQLHGGRRERDGRYLSLLRHHHAVGFHRTSVLSQDSLAMKKRNVRKGGGLTAVVDEDDGGVLVSGTLEIEKNDLGGFSSSPSSSSEAEDEDEESCRLKRKRGGSSYGDSFMLERKKKSSYLQAPRNLSHFASKRESRVVYHATPTMTSTVRYAKTGGVSSSSPRVLKGMEEGRKEKGYEGERKISQSIGKRLTAPGGGGESRSGRGGISDSIRAQGLSAVMRELERQEQEAEEREKEESSSSSMFFKKNRLYGLKQKFFRGASSSISSGEKERETSSFHSSSQKGRRTFPLQCASREEAGGGGCTPKERRLGLANEGRNAFRSALDLTKEHQSTDSLSCGPSSPLLRTAMGSSSSHGLSKTALLSSLPSTKDERSPAIKQENGGFVRVRKGVGLQKKK